jgi:hypothetical protein
LVERIVPDGVILIQPFQGRINRVYRPANEVRGSFEEVLEQSMNSESTTLAEPEAPPDASRPGCNVSEGEIKALLQIAEQDRVNGRYAEAKRRFSEVLDCDPNNQAAIDGLRRIAVVRN